MGLDDRAGAFVAVGRVNAPYWQTDSTGLVLGASADVSSWHGLAGTGAARATGIACSATRAIVVGENGGVWTAPGL